MSDPKVLRTLYLDPKTDELIRVVAFWEQKLKSDLMGDLIREALTARGIGDVDSYVAGRRQAVSETAEKPFRRKQVKPPQTRASRRPKRKTQ